jgi:hypothetical protein
VLPLPPAAVTVTELQISEVIPTEALINLLYRRGIISKQELLEENEGSPGVNKQCTMREF